jgi:hypothetical protein
VAVKTSGFSVLSLLLSGVGLGMILGTGPVAIFPAPFGVLAGVLALGSIKRSQPERKGRGMAIAGIVIGSAVTVLSVLVMIGSQAT